MGKKDMDDRMDEDEEPSIFDNLDRNLVLRETKVFNESNVDPAKCSLVITKILYLLNQGEEFSSEEAVEIFFACTKLFLSQNVHLRRMVYLIIKQLRVDSDSALIVVSCLSKDMTSTTDMYRANAIRVLAKVMDVSMFNSIDRFLKQAIVDKDPFVVTSTLIAGQHMWERGVTTIIKAWANELQSALRSGSPMSEYHALTLLYKIKSHDHLAVSKIVATLIRKPPNGHLAQCLVLRIIASLLESSGGSGGAMQQSLLSHLMNSLQDKSLQVMFEAARAVIKLSILSAVEIAPAVNVLQEFLASPIPAQRFCAVKSLSELVVRYPLIVTPCSSDLERLLTDSNRNTATLAITTLLKTGSEANVDRLMKSITSFMSEISDEFRVVMVNAIKTLCLKFPHKSQGLMAFLASALREEGGLLFKKAIVDALIEVIDQVPESKERGLDHLCEFIEDCEFSELLVKILMMLGEKGPKCSQPAKYIRFIFNRVILETAKVRAAAISAMAKFAIAVPSLAESIVSLMKRCLSDNDDEVRDRAVFYLNLIDKESEFYTAPAQASSLLANNFEASLVDLEFSLQVYLQQGENADAFSLSKHMLQVASDDADKQAEEEEAPGNKRKGGAASASASNSKRASAGVNPYLEVLNSVPEFADLGKLISSSQPTELTESEAEYVVTCVKHIYPEHVVLQYNITNNMEDQCLDNVMVEVELDNEEWAEEMAVPETRISCGENGVAFVVLQRVPTTYASGPIANTLKFELKDVEDGEVIEDDGMEDTYNLEELEVKESDFMKGEGGVGLVEFKRRWETEGNSNEQVKKYSLGMDNLQGAVDAVLDLLGMTACENSGVVPEDARSHACNLVGSFVSPEGNMMGVLARAGFMIGKSGAVSLKIAVRSENGEVNELLCGCIR